MTKVKQSMGKQSAFVWLQNKYILFKKLGEGNSMCKDKEALKFPASNKKP
jgi:hypothetical protein